MNVEHRCFETVMLIHSLTRALVGPLGLLALGASAQTAAASEPVRLTYNAPLAGYRSWNDQLVQSWRDANEAVGRIGGWRAYAREASAQKTTAAEPKAEAKPSSPQSHHHPGGEARP